MANEVKAKFGTPTAMTITLADLASSTGGLAARQSTMVDNSTVRAQRVYIYVKTTLHASSDPTNNTSIYVWLLQGDGTRRTDNAGASDAAITIKQAPLIGSFFTGTNAAADSFQRWFVVDNPGISWGIAIGHDTGQNLNASAENHSVYYFVDNPEIQ